MSKYVQQAVNAIIRPSRTEYDHEEMPFLLEGEDQVKYLRHPMRIENPRGQQLIGSLYHSADVQDLLSGGPCVIYMHGNASSQLEGQFLVPNFCRHHVYVFCFDFAGCGCSDGEYVSLGYYEEQDTKFLIQMLKSAFNLGPFVLWGRSMGAATALLIESPDVIGKVSDSSFTSIPAMCGAIALSMSLPQMFVPAVIWFLKKKIIQAADFDLETVSPLNVCKTSTTPIVFGHAENDQFIPMEQCRQLFDSVQTRNKFFMTLPGGHNSRREEDWIRLGVSFTLERFNIQVDDLQISECRKLQESTFHFESFSALVADTERHIKSFDNDNTEEIMHEFEQSNDYPGEIEEAESKHKHKKKDKKSKKKKDKEKKEKKHRHHSKKDLKDIESQTYDIFNLPPLSESSRAELPSEILDLISLEEKPLELTSDYSSRELLDVNTNESEEVLPETTIQQVSIEENASPNEQSNEIPIDNDKQNEDVGSKSLEVENLNIENISSENSNEPNNEVLIVDNSIQNENTESKSVEEENINNDNAFTISTNEQNEIPKEDSVPNQGNTDEKNERIMTLADIEQINDENSNEPSNAEQPIQSLQ